GLPGQGPVRVGIPIADLTAGMYLAQGILLAMIERNQSGQGQWVHTSLLEAQISMLDFQAARWLIDQDVPGQAGNDHPTGIPMGAFKTADGAVNIAAASGRLWTRFLEVAGAEELAEHPDYVSASLRSKNRAQLNQVIGEIMAKRTSQDWIESLSEAGVPCGPINSIDQTFAEPQVEHLGIAQPMHHAAKGTVNVVGQPVHLERTPQPPEIRLPTPELSGNTDEVLAELGYDEARIDDLRQRGVI
ncbi:MAG: CoA transferase, partial [Rhodospirillaceae bacterium]|nr:CoA transferase [Rhodospirillaceae bacterium]